MDPHLHLKHSYYSESLFIVQGEYETISVKSSLSLIARHSTTLSEWKPQEKCKELFLLLVGCCCYYHLVKGIKGSSGMKRLSQIIFSGGVIPCIFRSSFEGEDESTNRTVR